MSSKRNARIVGAYEHPRRVIPDRSVPEVHAEVVAGALADAGLSVDDVDGFFCHNDVGFGPISIGEYLGLNNIRCVDSTDVGGASPIVHVGHAVRAIAAGRCSVALVTMAGLPRS